MLRAKGNAISDLDEKAIEIGLNDAPIIKDQTKPEVGLNNQGKKHVCFIRYMKIRLRGPGNA
jgi:hypothetical protein